MFKCQTGSREVGWKIAEAREFGTRLECPQAVCVMSTPFGACIYRRGDWDYCGMRGTTLPVRLQEVCLRRTVSKKQIAILLMLPTASARKCT